MKNKTKLPELARFCLDYFFKNNHKITEELIFHRIDSLDFKELLASNQAIFVTLTKNNDLRGCIGSLEAYRSLCAEIIEHSYNAAFRDNRFSPLEKEELSEIKIEISLLKPREKISFSSISDLFSKVEPFKDGIYLKYGFHSATFLPQVWETLPDKNDFFRNLCYKANLPESILSDSKLVVEKYAVEKYLEN